MEEKIYLHHYHITGKIRGYAHSFCNLKVRENNKFFSLFAHNLFRFGFFLFCQRNQTVCLEDKKSSYQRHELDKC